MVLCGPESHADGFTPRLYPIYPGWFRSARYGPYREIIYALIGVSGRIRRW